MMMYKIGCVFLCCLIWTSCSQSTGFLYEKNYTNLKNEPTSLIGLKENRFTVFIAFANDCPVCKASIPTLRQVEEKFPNVGLVLFYPANQKDSSINSFIADLLPPKTQTVKDKNKYLTHYLNATVTPHAFIVDSLGSVIYQGAINNGVFANYRKNYAKQESFLVNALDTLITFNDTLIRNETKVVGCYIE